MIGTLDPHKGYIDRTKIPWRKIELEEQCHNDRWTTTHEVAYREEVEFMPAEKVMLFDKIYELLDEAEYCLMDGINMPYHARTFDTAEYETIKGVIAFVWQMFEKEAKK